MGHNATAFAGDRGRVQLVVLDHAVEGDKNTLTFNLLAHHWRASLTSNIEDITYAYTPLLVDLNDLPGPATTRFFASSWLPRFDFQCDAFWTFEENPFNEIDVSSNSCIMQHGQWCIVNLWFEMPELQDKQDWSFPLMLTSFEIETSIRDVYRFMFSGVGMLRQYTDNTKVPVGLDVSSHTSHFPFSP